MAHPLQFGARMSYGTVSKALHKSTDMRSVSLSTSINVSPFQKDTKIDRHDLPLVKPYWLSQITYLFSTCLNIVSRRVCSMVLPSTKVRLASFKVSICRYRLCTWEWDWTGHYHWGTSRILRKNMVLT